MPRKDCINCIIDSEGILRCWPLRARVCALVIGESSQHIEAHRSRSYYWWDLWSILQPATREQLGYFLGVHKWCLSFICLWSSGVNCSRITWTQFKLRSQIGWPQTWLNNIRKTFATPLWQLTITINWNLDMRIITWKTWYSPRVHFVSFHQLPIILRRI